MPVTLSKSVERKVASFPFPLGSSCLAPSLRKANNSFIRPEQRIAWSWNIKMYEQFSARIFRPSFLTCQGCCLTVSLSTLSNIRFSFHVSFSLFSCRSYVCTEYIRNCAYILTVQKTFHVHSFFSFLYIYFFTLVIL